MTPFAASVATEIVATVPSWQAFVRHETQPDGTVVVVVEIPPPDGCRALGGLRIDTSNDEITVSFDHYRAHFERWGVRERGAEHEAASMFAFAIVNDAVRIASAWDGERWCGSCFLDLDEEPDFTSAPGATHLRIRSWSGRYDDDRTLAG